MTEQVLSASEEFYALCYQGNLDGAKEQLDLGAEVHFTASNGWTALHGACHAGRLEVVKFLVAQGVEVESPNKLGQTPLHLAAASGHVDITNWLVDIMGCDKGATTAGGSSAASMARNGGHPQVVAALGETA